MSEKPEQTMNDVITILTDGEKKADELRQAAEALVAGAEMLVDVKIVGGNTGTFYAAIDALKAVLEGKQQ